MQNWSEGGRRPPGGPHAGRSGASPRRETGERSEPVEWRGRAERRPPRGLPRKV
jgi:hypothetical protein